MLNYKSSFLSKDATLRETTVAIELSDGKIALIVDEDEKLIGTITDGDIRRGLIDGLKFEDSIETIIFKTPTTAHINERANKKALISRMQEFQILQIPLLDDDNRVVGLETISHLSIEEKRENWVILMAGGEGRRLRPLTENTPKPMLEIGGKPILETTIQNFIDAGFENFIISVNYKSDIIKDYFKDGRGLGVNIEYLEEDTPLDTAGSLTLLKEKPTQPFIVMNGDILTKINFENVLEFHETQNSIATMCVREYSIQVPYGIVNSEDFKFQSVQEKPNFSYFVNAGIYTFSPEALDLIEPNTPLRMTDFFENLKSAGKDCYTYPVHEYWLDIGKMDDYNHAVNNFSSIFK